jgi:hypothetical protein
MDTDNQGFKVDHGRWTTDHGRTKGDDRPQTVDRGNTCLCRPSSVVDFLFLRDFLYVIEVCCLNQFLRFGVEALDDFIRVGRDEAGVLRFVTKY